MELNLPRQENKRHIISHMHVSFIIPQFKNHILCAVQASPWSTFVKYTYPDKSREGLSCALDFVLSGRCWRCNGPLGEGREGSPHTVRVHECIFVLCWNLKRYRILTMLVRSRSLPVVLSTRALLVFHSGHQVRVTPGDARKKKITSNHLGTEDQD